MSRIAHDWLPAGALDLAQFETCAVARGAGDRRLAEDANGYMVDV